MFKMSFSEIYMVYSFLTCACANEENSTKEVR